MTLTFNKLLMKTSPSLEHLELSEEMLQEGKFQTLKLFN